MNKHKILEAIKDENADVKPLTREQIVEKLKNMTVGGDILPIKFFHVITPNPDYDPENYDPKLDGKVDYISPEEPDRQIRIVHYVSDTNNERWQKNHTKICMLKLWPNIFAAECINWTDGTRNYYSEEYVDKIIDFCKEYGGVIDFC